MRGGAGRGRIGIVVTLLAALLVGVAGQAGAQGGYEEPTRKQWVREADDICERPYRRGNRLVDRFGERAERERWVPAGKILVRLSKIILGVTDRVEDLQRPPEDADAIQTWLDGEERGAELFKKAGRKLKDKKVRRAAKLLDRSDRIVEKSHKAVKGFGLKECV